MPGSSSYSVCAVYHCGGHLPPVRSASLPNSSLLLDAQASPMALAALCCLSPAKSIPVRLACHGERFRAQLHHSPSTSPGWACCSPHWPPTRQGLEAITLLAKSLLTRHCWSLQGTDPHCSQTPQQTATPKGRKGRKLGTSRVLQDTGSRTFQLF